MPLGVHTSIEGGIYKAVQRAAELGCDTMQLFGRNPRGWRFRPVKREDIRRFKAERRKAGIAPVSLHASYLINLCSPDDALFKRSLGLFKKELSLARSLGADFFVTHLGSPLKRGKDFAFRRVLEALEDVRVFMPGLDVEILLENTSGSGSSFGSSLSDIGRIIEVMKGRGLGVGLCFDTCHGFAAGYPMSTPCEVNGLVRTIKRDAGLENLRLIHLNDSKGAPGSRLDRHEHIGEGFIGIEGLRAIVNHPDLSMVPFILETPKRSVADDRRNLEVVRRMMADRSCARQEGHRL